MKVGWVESRFRRKYESDTDQLSPDPGDFHLPKDGILLNRMMNRPAPMNIQKDAGRLLTPARISTERRLMESKHPNLFSCGCDRIFIRILESTVWQTLIKS